MDETFPVKMTPKEFEKLVRKFLIKKGAGIPTLEVLHDVKERVDEQEYQIDVKATYELLGGVQFVVLVECKHHKAPIKRDVVVILKDRLLETGSHKGIVFSTSPFQSGALEYGKRHGIALAQIIDGRANYLTKGQDKEIDENDSPMYILKRQSIVPEGIQDQYIYPEYNLEDLWE